MRKLLFQLLPQIVEAIQIIAGMADATLGFAPSLLVQRYPRRLLKERHADLPASLQPGVK